MLIFAVMRRRSIGSSCSTTEFSDSATGVIACLRPNARELACQGGGAFGSRHDLLQVAADRFVRADLLRQQLGIAKYRREHVVEIVRDTASELADGFELLRLSQLLLEGRVHTRALAPQIGFTALSLDGGDEPGEAAFHEEVGRPGLQRRDGRLLADGPRDDDERNVESGVRSSAERFGRGEGRHAVVGHHDVPGIARERREHRVGRVDTPCGDLVVALRELVKQELRIGCGVLDHQDPKR